MADAERAASCACSSRSRTTAICGQRRVSAPRGLLQAERAHLLTNDWGARFAVAQKCVHVGDSLRGIKRRPGELGERRRLLGILLLNPIAGCRCRRFA